VDAFLAELTPEKAAYPPLRGYHYSNMAYGLLGVVTERITGESWETQLAKRLLEPLGMTRTTYHAMEPFARGYVVHPWHGTLREEPRHDAGAMAPAGQLWSTVEDLATWADFLAVPSSAVLDPATVAEMCAPVAIADPERWTAGHGLGLQLWRRGERVYVGHSGSMPGYQAMLVVHRASRTAVVTFANAYNFGRSGLAFDLLDAVLDTEPAPVTPWRPGAAPPADVEPLTGRWWWMGREYQAAWHESARELVLTRVGEDLPPWRFTAESPDRWRCRSGMNDGEIMAVRRGRGGAVAALDIATFVFTRDPWPAL
jgi:CubicO group peptidase (beta-lactamase class C family)